MYIICCHRNGLPAFVKMHTQTANKFSLALSSFFFTLKMVITSIHCWDVLFIVQELCESRGGRPKLSVLTSLLVSVDVKQHSTNQSCPVYCVIQAGLLTPLTFARHRLSPLAAFTSSAYFLHSGRRWQWICNFYAANFKDIFGGPYSECVWQQAITCCSCYRMPQKAFSSTNSQSSGQPKKWCKDTFFHPPSPFPGNFCNYNSAGICTASQF